MAHDESEAYPWHVRARSKVFGDAVRAACANKESSGAIPEIKQADEIEEGYA
jgi:hypothetical protein